MLERQLRQPIEWLANCPTTPSIDYPSELADILRVDRQIILDAQPGLFVLSPDMGAQDGQVWAVLAVHGEIDLARALFVLITQR